MNYDLRRDYGKIRQSIESKLEFVKFNFENKRLNIFNNKENYKFKDGGAMYFLIDKEKFMNEVSDLLLGSDPFYEGYMFNDTMILELGQISKILSSLYLKKKLTVFFENETVPDFHTEIATGNSFCQFAIMGLNASNSLNKKDFLDLK